VAEIVRRHDLLAVPVLDPAGRMQGIITVDDIGDVVQEEAAEDLLEMSGSEERTQAPPGPRRRGWRSALLAFAGGGAAAALVGLFAGVLDDWGAVATLLPLLLVLGITAASQAALALERAYESRVERHQIGRVHLREALTGAATALVGGLLAGGLALVLHFGRRHAVAIGIPLALGLWAASLMGALGAGAVRQRGGRLAPAAHTAIVIVALLVAISVYLLTAGWLAGFASARQR
jgi:magnesium transporter